jgi:hypothetical protein
MLRMEDRIRTLCAELLVTKGDEEVRPIIVALRDALRLHVEHMRERFCAYPYLVERRARNDTSPVNEQHQEDTATKPSPRDTDT